MDPEQTLSEIRYLQNEIKKASRGEFTDLVINTLFEINERFQALDNWLSTGGFSPWPANDLPNHFANGNQRMSDAQRNRLWQMCADYNVPFRESDYERESSGMVVGWIGGINKFTGMGETIYVGVEPNGRSHT